MRVEVAYARPEVQLILPLEVPAGTRAMAAIEASRIAEQIPGLDLARAVIGVFGQVVSHDRVLEEGDRVEIYRPLPLDPKLARRARVARRKRRR